MNDAARIEMVPIWLVGRVAMTRLGSRAAADTTLPREGHHEESVLDRSHCSRHAGRSRRSTFTYQPVETHVARRRDSGAKQ